MKIRGRGSEGSRSHGHFDCALTRGRIVRLDNAARDAGVACKRVTAIESSASKMPPCLQNPTPPPHSFSEMEACAQFDIPPLHVESRLRCKLWADELLERARSRLDPRRRLHV